ncbi:MAG: ATP synthase F1 subunit epsilon [Planctomycetes bacterium]|nr:ATP synthase F1 subunit epsilon [Planctomycetota bacterium]
MPETLQCRVITPEGEVLNRRALSVRYPAHDGQVGILPNHAPMITLVGEGSLILRTPENRRWFLEMKGGFAEIRDNLLTILAVRTGDLIEQSAEAIERPLAEAKRELAKKDKP